MSYRHFVFDLDGTLIDSRQDLADAANVLLASYDAGPLTTDAIVAMVGEGARVLVERVLQRASLDVDVDTALARFIAAYDDRLTVHTRPYEGVTTLLEELAAEGCRLSVLTNKPQRSTDLLLEALGLRRLLADVIGGDTAYGRKPSPDGLRALISGSGVPADETVMIGDTWVDLATARNAGIDACLAAYGFGVADMDATARATARVEVQTPAAIRALAHNRPPALSTPPATPA